MTTPQKALQDVIALGEAIHMIEGCRAFVTSREKIKHPEGTDLFDESLRVIRQTAAMLADEVERWKSCNKQNAGELDDIRSLTRPLFKNVDPMPGDCMIGVNRSVTVYGYVRDVVKQLEIARQHGQHFAGLEAKYIEAVEKYSAAADRCHLLLDAKEYWRQRAEQAESELSQCLAELAAAREAMQAVTALLPGSYYMDPPDGGSVTVLEQLQRMAADAERYRRLRNQGPARDERPFIAIHGAGGLSQWTGDKADAVIDATLQRDRQL